MTGKHIARDMCLSGTTAAGAHHQCPKMGSDQHQSRGRSTRHASFNATCRSPLEGLAGLEGLEGGHIWTGPGQRLPTGRGATTGDGDVVITGQMFVLECAEVCRAGSHTPRVATLNSRFGISSAVGVVS